MAQASELFMTQREKVIAAYKSANQPFTAATKPYKSTVSFQFNAANTIANAAVTWIVAAPGQALDWFGYALNDPVPGNESATAPYRNANEADTNISKARTTNGAEDFVIEGMSCSNRSLRSFTDNGASELTGVPAQAVQGQVPIYDPAALYLPPQLQSPFNLQNGLFRTLAPYVAVEFEWDRRRIEKIGTLDQIPEGAANSYLMANGEPSTNDRYRIPEGYIWRREGEPDCEFIVRGRLQDAIAVPVLDVAQPTSGTLTILNTPVQTWLDVVVRLHGLSVKLPTRN